ncbi:MAG: hypothetical protein GX951_05325 [Mollicutes bacterium]|nr:hypothetical protein [Mollicutes bacterium]
MRRLYRLKNEYQITLQSEILSFPTPEYIYIPIKEGWSPLVKEKDRILKGDILLKSENNMSFSPVSGIINGIEEKNFDGVKQKCFVIKNDFKEKEKSYDILIEDNYDKENILNILYVFGFNYYASRLESGEIKTLIINSIEDEPYMYNKNLLLNNFVNKILATADIFSEAFELSNSHIAIKSSDTTNIEKYISLMGTYPNIDLCLIEDYYLVGKEPFLLEYLDYKKQDTLVIDIEDIIRIYDAIKHHKFNYNKFITISGPNLKRSVVIEVKIGSLLTDVIENTTDYKYKSKLNILNGPMMGYKCDPNKEIVTVNTKGLFILNEYKTKEESCNNCGLCYKMCPVKVNPKKVMKTGKPAKACLDCGLCSYICPSHINLRAFLEDKNE